jgi:hypothetical protein
LHLAQIIHRVAIVQGQPVDLGPDIFPNDDEEAEEPEVEAEEPEVEAEEPEEEAEEPEVEAEAQEVVTVGSDSTASFDMQPEQH